MDKLSKYLEDLNFVRWVFDTTPEMDRHWDQFMREHPDEIKSIQHSRSIMLQFRTIAKTLSEEEKIILFSRVLNEIEKRQKVKTTYRFFSEVLKYAAIAIIFFSAGVLLFYRDNPVIPAFYTSSLNDRIPENQAQLIRASGETVILDKQCTVLEYKKNGELVINNDTLKPVNSDSKGEQKLNQLIIPYGKTSELILPDGTKVFLNAGSRLIYPDLFTGDTRDVFLVGEAYFEVEHDSKHPFIVQVNELRIKDLGTKFNVSAYPSDGRIETVLTEGKVSIQPGNSGLFTRSTELIPGQLASFNKQNLQISVESVNVDDYILWTQGVMRFETAELSRIIKKLERYFNVRFEYKDPMLGSLLISGKLALKEDRQEVFERIARAASVKIVEIGDNYYEVVKN